MTTSSDSRYHVTVVLPAGVSYWMDEWNVDAADGWTVQQFFNDMCADLNISAADYWLIKGGVPLIAESLISDSVAAGDVISVVDA